MKSYDLNKDDHDLSDVEISSTFASEIKEIKNRLDAAGYQPESLIMAFIIGEGTSKILVAHFYLPDKSTKDILVSRDYVMGCMNLSTGKITAPY